MQTNVKICNNYEVCTASYKIRIAYDYDMPVFIVAESKELCSVLQTIVPLVLFLIR